jgi:hypothetical protein
MEKLGFFVTAIGILLAVAVLMAWPVQYLWNNDLIPALGLNVLFGILFKSNTTVNKK